MPKFDRRAHIEELEAIVGELESLPETPARESLLFERRRELRFWKAHEHFFTFKAPLCMPKGERPP